MKTEIELLGTTICVKTNVDLAYPAWTDTLHIYSGPFALIGLGDPEPRKALIAALIEADAELDAAAEKRKEAAA